MCNLCWGCCRIRVFIAAAASQLGLKPQAQYLKTLVGTCRVAQAQQESAGKGWVKLPPAGCPQGEGCHMPHFNTAGLLARES